MHVSSMRLQSTSWPKLPKSQRAFTLIEVLLAMSITAITAVMAYQAMDSAGRLAEVTQEEGDDLQKLSSAMNLIAQDFRHIVRRKIRDPEGGNQLQLGFLYNEFSLPMLAFTRNGKINPQLERFQRDHLERVHYQLEDKQLIRSSWLMVDHYDDNEPQKVVLFKQVDNFNLELIQLETPSLPQVNNGAISVGPSQLKRYQKWPPEQGIQQIPDGVTLTIESSRWGKIIRTFELVGEM